MSTAKVANISNLAGSKTITTDDLIDRATCRAWVNFNGTGTVAIRASFNVTSIIDNGTGDYTINFTNAMPDANYALSLNGSPQNGRFYSNWNGTYNNSTTPITNNVSYCRVICSDSGGISVDSTNVYVAVFR